MFISWLRPPRQSISSVTLIAMSTPKTQILVYKYHSPTKEIRLFGEIADIRLQQEKLKMNEKDSAMTE